MAIPCICRKISPANSRSLFFSTIFVSSANVAASTLGLSLSRVALCTDEMPSSCGMFVYNETTSREASIALGETCRFLILFNKSAVSDVRGQTLCHRLEVFSVALAQEETIGLIP